MNGPDIFTVVRLRNKSIMWLSGSSSPFRGVTISTLKSRYFTVRVLSGKLLHRFTGDWFNVSNWLTSVLPWQWNYDREIFHFFCNMFLSFGLLTAVEPLDHWFWAHLHLPSVHDIEKLVQRKRLVVVTALSLETLAWVIICFSISFDCFRHPFPRQTSTALIWVYSVYTVFIS